MTNKEIRTEQAADMGPLVVSRNNPRYFAIASSDGTEKEAVYLTGSHIWNNFQDGLGPGGACADTPERNDYKAYLAFLKEHNHNFIRLWRWEQFKSQAADGGFHLCMTPQPWARSGEGKAKDGKPKFDLLQLNDEYFERLRERVIAAGNEGIYVAVMFFDGWGLHLSPSPDNVEGHPFHGANNINGIKLTSILDYQVLPLDPEIQALQETYIRRVVDTIQDLHNVLYEVANESSGGGEVDPRMAEAMGLTGDIDWGDSTEWQYWVINFVKEYEQEKGYIKHPIGMTMQFPVPDQSKVNDPLFNGPADWISPGFDDEIFKGGHHPGEPGFPETRWYIDPPANDGAKIVIADTDHFAPGKGDALWAWKSFLRGHHPILMDFGIIDLVKHLDPSTGVPPYEFYKPARYAMGDTLSYARKVDLSKMLPHNDLSSTGYVLASSGEAYIVLQPEAESGPFTVTLEAGEYEAEWHNVTTRETIATENVAVENSAERTFTVPFKEAAPAVLFLKKV